MNKICINSSRYWEDRFASKDWEAAGGQKQTNYFAKLFFLNLPQEIKDLIASQKSLCDWGCGEGQFSNELKERFSDLDITGIDISESAIRTASTLYPKCFF